MIQFRLPTVFLCVWRLIVWQQVLLLLSDSLDVVIFGKQVFCGVTLGLAMFLWQQWQRSASPNTTSPPIQKACLRNFRSQPGSISLPLPISTLGAIFDAHNWHQDPDRASTATRGTGESFLLLFTLFSCFMAEEFRANKSHRINQSPARMCTPWQKHLSMCWLIFLGMLFFPPFFLFGGGQNLQSN